MGSLLLPALGRARMRSGQAACLNHLRQLHLALPLYALDNEDRLPYNLGVSEIKENLVTKLKDNLGQQCPELGAGSR